MSWVSRWLMLVFLWMSPGARAALPEACRAAFRAVYAEAVAEGDRSLGMTAAESEGLLLSAQFSDRYIALLQVAHWLRDPQREGVLAWLSLELASPGFSSADAVEMRDRRAFLLQSALSRSGQSLPPEFFDLLTDLLVAFPHVKGFEPLTLENTDLRINAAMAKVTDADWIEVYKAWKIHSVYPYRGAPLPWVPAGDMKKFFRQKRGKPELQNIRNELARFVGIRARAFLTSHQTEMNNVFVSRGSFNPVLSKFDAWAEKEKVPSLFAAVLKAHLYEVFGDPPRPEYRPRDVRDVLEADLSRRARRLVEEYRAILPAAPVVVVDPKPAPEIRMVPVNPKSVATGISRRRRARENAREQAQREIPSGRETEAAPKPTSELSDTEKQELYSRMAPDQGYVDRFNKQMDKASTKWPGEYPDFERNIVGMLQGIESGTPAGDLLEPSANHGVWKFRPLGRSSTSRLFLGEIDGEFVLLKLVHDIKSGENYENRICDELEREVRQIRAAWESEEP